MKSRLIPPALILIIILQPIISPAQTLIDIIDPTKTSRGLLTKVDGQLENPNLLKQFKTGEIFLKSKKESILANLNINILNQEILVLVDSRERPISLSKINYISLKISDDSSAIFLPIENEILLKVTKDISGPTLYKRFRKKFVKGIEGNGYSEGTKDRLENLEDYYLVYNNKKINFKGVKELVKVLKENWPDMPLDTNFKQLHSKSELNKILFLINQLAP